ncbi:hypothetical protein, partial [Klebsiella pneumoniae]|uniref:hypothetical protein n=1 Tax=Klebsiella pneumoniae TaxID=573 RepID=UPI0035327FA8
YYVAVFITPHIQRHKAGPLSADLLISISSDINFGNDCYHRSFHNDRIANLIHSLTLHAIK